jgi:hypothetical protein
MIRSRLYILGRLPRRALTDAFYKALCLGRYAQGQFAPGSWDGTVALVGDRLGLAVLMRRRHRRVPPLRSGFAGFRFPMKAF